MSEFVSRTGGLVWPQGNPFRSSSLKCAFMNIIPLGVSSVQQHFLEPTDPGVTSEAEHTKLVRHCQDVQKGSPEWWV